MCTCIAHDQNLYILVTVTKEHQMNVLVPVNTQTASQPAQSVTVQKHPIRRMTSDSDVGLPSACAASDCGRRGADSEGLGKTYRFALFSILTYFSIFLYFSILMFVHFFYFIQQFTKFYIYFVGCPS